jgi:hypothetical protein
MDKSKSTIPQSASLKWSQTPCSKVSDKLKNRMSLQKQKHVSLKSSFFVLKIHSKISKVL